MTEAPFDVRTFELANGLPVLVVPMPHVHRAHVAFFVRIGSRYESRKTNGLSHFLEHMIYRGTDSLPSAHEVNFAFEELGGALGAETLVDASVFSVSLPEEGLEKVAPLFADVLSAPRFFDIGLEKRIVREEILEDRDDDGREIDADNLARKLIYPAHPLGFTITGDPENVESFTEKDLRAHHASHYAAKNGVLLLAGAVDGRAAERLAAPFARLASGQRLVSEVPRHDQKKPRLLVVENASSQTQLRVSFRAFGENHELRPALEMFMRVLDDGMSTRLYRRISDEQGLCYEVTAGYDGYEDDGIVDIRADVVHERTPVVARAAIAAVRELAETGPTDREIEKAKKRFVWDMRTLRDSPEDFGARIAFDRLLGRSITTPEWRERFLAIGPAEVQAVARLLLEKERLNIVAVGLLEESHERDLEALIGA